MFIARKDSKNYIYFSYVVNGQELFRSSPYLKVSTENGLKWVSR